MPATHLALAEASLRGRRDDVGVRNLRLDRHVRDEFTRRENEAARAHQEAVSRLFDEEPNPLVVIKWKETLDFLEDATDRCEDVANVIEGVMVKHG